MCLSKHICILKHFYIISLCDAIYYNTFKFNYYTIPDISSVSSVGDDHAAATAPSLAMNSFGIPLTGSMPAGITLGFMKG